CRWLHQRGFAHHDIRILDFDPGPRRIPAEPFDGSEYVSNHPDDALLARLKTSHPTSHVRFEGAARLWESFGPARRLRRPAGRAGAAQWTGRLTTCETSRSPLRVWARNRKK